MRKLYDWMVKDDSTKGENMKKLMLAVLTVIWAMAAHAEGANEKMTPAECVQATMGIPVRAKSHNATYRQGYIDGFCSVLRLERDNKVINTNTFAMYIDFMLVAIEVLEGSYK